MLRRSLSHAAHTQTMQVKLGGSVTQEEAPFRPRREEEGDGGGEDTRNHGMQRGMSKGGSLA